MTGGPPPAPPVIGVLGLGEAGGHIAAGLAAQAAVPFADIAIMAPVPGRGLRVPMLASRPAAVRAGAILGGCGETVAVLDSPAGAAATRKLLRSVFSRAWPPR